MKHPPLSEEFNIYNDEARAFCPLGCLNGKSGWSGDKQAGFRAGYEKSYIDASRDRSRFRHTKV
jgi:hypothetical protein